MRRRLAELSAMGAKTARAGSAIAAAAVERREVIEAKIAELRPRVLTDSAAADEYQALIHERGQLDIVLGSARPA